MRSRPPVGDYNPDWAVAFKEGTVKHIYFVAEIRGSMSSMGLRAIELSRIKCAERFFRDMNKCIDPENITYGVVDSFEKLRALVG